MCPINKPQKLWLDIRITGSSSQSTRNGSTEVCCVVVIYQEQDITLSMLCAYLALNKKKFSRTNCTRIIEIPQTKRNPQMICIHCQNSLQEIPAFFAESYFISFYAFLYNHHLSCPTTFLPSPAKGTCIVLGNSTDLI